MQRGRQLGLTILIFYGSISCFAGQLGNWNYTNSLNVARSGNVAVLAQNTIIFTFGGYAYSTTPYPVERATIKPNGSLSSWVIDSSPMQSARNTGLGFSANGYIYAISGDNGIGFSTTVERAQVNSNGTLGSWTTIGILPRGFFQSSLVQSSTFIYIIGGWSGSSDVFRTAIIPDGSLGTWELLSSKLEVGRFDHMSILINTTLYVVGGEDSGGFQTINIERAYLYPDGKLSAFSTISYTVASHISGSLFYDGQYLNVVGGYYAGNPDYRSERAQVNPDGSLGIWQPAPALQMERDFFGYVQTSTNCYVIGASEGGDSASVEYAPLIPTGIEKSGWEIF